MERGRDGGKNKNKVNNYTSIWIFKPYLDGWDEGIIQENMDDLELDLRRVDVFGCHRGDRGYTTQSAVIQYAIERISKLEKKDCCSKVESLIIVTGTEVGYLY